MAIRDRVKELRRVRASELLPNPKNWRMHPKKQSDALRGILAEVGYADALLARETEDGRLMLIDGHLRAETTPDTEVPVLVLDLDERESDLLLGTLDPLAGLAETNRDALRALAGTLEVNDDAIRALIAKTAKLQSSETDDGPAPEPPKKPVSKPGDLWLLGDHRLLCGDSTKPEDVTRLLDGRKPFIMVTDPPYGVEYDPGWRNDAAAKGIMSFADRREGQVENDARIDWTDTYKLACAPVAYVWHAGRHARIIAENLEAAQYEMRTQIIWKKTIFAISRGHYHWQHEPCWYAVRRGTSAKWCGDRTQSTIWEISNQVDQKDNSNHGTQKPVECMARPIRNHGGADDDVYDPFLGSGTTIIAAEKLNRRCYGLEISPAYCDVVIERYERLTGGKAIRG